MTQFSQVRHKIENTFKEIHDSFKELKNKKNQEFILNQLKRTFKNPFVIYDSDWTSIAPDSNDLTTINKSTLLPESISVDLETIISFPERYLPYIKPLIFIKPTPDSTLSTFIEYTTENWSGDFFRIKGNSSTIYEGQAITSTHTLELADLISRQVSEARTKKVFQATITYLDFSDSNNEKELTGILAGLNVIETIEDSPLGNPQSNDILCFALNEGFFADDPDHKILDLTTTQATVMADVTRNRYVDDGMGGEELESTTTYEEITVSIIESATNSVLLEIGSNVITHDDTVESITSPTLNGYRGYYSTNTEEPIAISLSGENYIIPNPPNELEPYTTITLERNYDDYPLTTTEATNLFIESTESGSPTGNPIDQEFTWWRIAEAVGNNVPVFKFKYKAGITILAPARTSIALNNIKTQDYTYTLSGGTYSLTTSDTGTKSKLTYETTKTDVQYRLLFVITNPFIYKELRNYNYDQSNFKPN